MAVRAHSDRFGSSPLRGAKSVKLPSLGELSELVGALYDAALDPARWPAALERLAAAFEAAQATLSFDPSGREETAETFGAGGEVLKAKGVGSGLLAAVWRLGDGVLVLWRRDHAGRKKSDLQRIALLGPHLRRAVQAARRFAELGLERAKALDALDRLPRGVLLLQAKGQVGFVNAAAREILARADGLVIRRGALHAVSCSQDPILQQLIAAALGAGGAAPAFGGRMSIARASGRQAYGLLVLPSRDPSRAAAGPLPGAVVLIADPDREPALPAAHLRQLYGLTPAEAAVAVLVSRGERLQSIARSLDVTLSTARVHLQRVFGKTGTCRQADLVRLLGAHDVFRIEEAAPRIGAHGLRKEHAMKHHAIARFPEHAEKIEALSGLDAAFDALCHRYGQVVERLGHLEKPAAEPDYPTEAEDLRRRRAALEEELLLAVNVNRP